MALFEAPISQEANYQNYPYANPEMEDPWATPEVNPYSKPEGEWEDQEMANYANPEYEGQWEYPEMANYGNPEYEGEWEYPEMANYGNPEYEGEWEYPEMANYANPEYEGQWEDQEMPNAQYEGDAEFWRKIKKFAKKAWKTAAPLAKKLAPKLAGTLVGMIPGVGAVASPLAAKLTGALVKEGEMEAVQMEAEFFGTNEVEAEVANTETAYEAALTEFLAAQAAEATTEAEAEAAIAATLPITITIMGGRRALRPVMPVMAQATGRLTRLMRQQGTTGKQLLRTIPTIQRQTAATLKAIARSGQPINSATVVKAMANTTNRVLSNPQRVQRAIVRNAVLRQRTAYPAIRRAVLIMRPLWLAADQPLKPETVTMTMPLPLSKTHLKGVTPAPANELQGVGTAGERQLLDNWLAIQGINLMRHAKSLRPFTKDEFGTGPMAPSEAHIEAVNRFIDKFRTQVVEMARWVEAAANMARRESTTERLQVLLERKQVVSDRVLYVEGIWDFYFDLFVQRLSSFGERLRAVDRIAAGCYEKVYVGLGTAQPTPSLLPLSYADSGFSPATFRRGVPLSKLKHNPNLFPLIMLPQHRLDNVWALSSVLHEVSHNLQADLGLWEIVPVRLFQRLTREGGFPPEIAQIWARWHKEMMADLFALLLGGPAAVESMMDVVARSPAGTVRFSPLSVHPTPYLRVPISLILLRRLGLEQMATNLMRIWQRLYPRVTPNDIPPAFMKTFQAAAEMAVDTMVFQPYPQLANQSMAQVVTFGPEQMQLIELAGHRLARGEDSGTIPVRLMVSAARFALDRQLAAPQTITDNFYRILGRR